MNKPFILCAEDNENDVALMQRVLNNKLPQIDYHFYDNVNDCISFLDHSCDQRQLPILALVDIKLINSNGLDLLKYIKEDTRYHDIPVIMLSSSARNDDKVRAEEWGCDDYFEKPKNYLELKSTLPKIILDWVGEELIKN
ncbi:MAG: response regulator [Saprospiraceae bacterium]